MRKRARWRPYLGKPGRAVCRYELSELVDFARFFTTFAGLPATTTSCGTSFVTTDLAETMERSLDSHRSGTVLNLNGSADSDDCEGFKSINEGRDRYFKIKSVNIKLPTIVPQKGLRVLLAGIAYLLKRSVARG